jgi:hypothetical protein
MNIKKKLNCVHVPIFVFCHHFFRKYCNDLKSILKPQEWGFESPPEYSNPQLATYKGSVTYWKCIKTFVWFITRYPHKQSLDLNNSRHYYNETNKRMDCSNSKISTLSKVKIICAASCQGTRYGPGFWRNISLNYFLRCWCFPPTCPPTVHVPNIFEKRWWVGNHPKDLGHIFPCLWLIHYPITMNLVKLWQKRFYIHLTTSKCSWNKPTPWSCRCRKSLQPGPSPYIFKQFVELVLKVRWLTFIGSGKYLHILRGTTNSGKFATIVG